MRKCGESAAGLSELEKLGGLFPIQYRRVDRRTTPQAASTLRLNQTLMFFFCKKEKERKCLFIGKELQYNTSL